MTPKTYEIMAAAADAEGNTLFIIVDGDTGLSVEPNTGYDTYAEAYEALQDIEEAEQQALDANEREPREDYDGYSF